MTNRTLDDLTQRFDRLERENRWLKRMGTIVLVGATAVALMGQRGAAPVVEAQRFLIRDPASGKARAALSLLQDGSVGLSLISVDGKSLSLSADVGGNMGLILVDSNRTFRAELTAGADGSPALILRDRSGKVIWKAP